MAQQNQKKTAQGSSKNTAFNVVEGDWIQLKGIVKQKWGKITEDELTAINGSKDKLVGKLIAKYNMTKEEAQKEIDRFWS